MLLSQHVPSLEDRLATLYGDQAQEALAAVNEQFADVEPRGAALGPSWSERDVVLITYADQLRDPEHCSPLAALKEWLLEHQLRGKLSTVHLLPFCPFSSDDGFSVIDYLRVDPAAGDWDDIAGLGEPFDLMFDLVLNHISQHSQWFHAYLRGEAPYDKFFVEADPALDYLSVVRPRSLPLLTPVEVNGETRHVWTTFSADQIDLNYAEPAVLARMLRILVEYARRGARIIRLDAIAFLWKQLGTTCLHLPRTHEIVKLMRDVTTACEPGTLILTETNVPHKENVSYFGDPPPGLPGDEAHMVYQFSLPPLLLEAFLSGSASAIHAWLSSLAPPPPGCTFFNFTASHDGVGVRPLEGLVSQERFDALIDAVRARGARINTRRQPDGTDTPYELCIAYFDALTPNTADTPLHARRFLASQAVMLGLQGMPAVYFHSLVGTPNDTAGADSSGIHRRINRRKYNRKELDAVLGDPTGVQRQVFDGYRDLLAKRVAEPAFHPEASQRVLTQAAPSVLAFERRPAEGRSVLVAVNFAEESATLDLPERYRQGAADLISGIAIPPASTALLAPGQAVWLVC
ncbi:MAG: alpha-glucosidase C-terminal domain-containing protein [Planctomycetales bacterium]|nr:alpha-glucosidase C-terminal domain-containing protein [Planctomycetales bacterium]